MADYQVKGSSIRSKFEFVRDRFGSPAARELRDGLSDMPEPLLDSSMYLFTFYDRVIREIADRFFDGDLERLREVGEYSAERVLTGVYKAFASGKDFVGFLRRAAMLHERFYSHGRMTVEIDADGESARVHLIEAPEYSEADLQVAAGFYLGAARLTGLEEVSCDFTRDEAGARFELAWKGRSG